MKYTLEVEVSANIELSDTDFNIIQESMCAHYDGTVVSATRVGGFIYGFGNSRVLSEGKNKTHNVSRREISLMLKGLETNSSTKSRVLGQSLWDILNKMSEKNEEINKQLS